jgi:hypothetical protein
MSIGMRFNILRCITLERGIIIIYQRIPILIYSEKYRVVLSVRYRRQSRCMGSTVWVKPILVTSRAGA